MAVAWSKSKVGRATGDVTIRDPVVLTATLPRFLLNGDRGTMHLDLDNVEGGAGEYKIEARSEGIDVIGNAAAANAAAQRQGAQLGHPAADRDRGGRRQGGGQGERARRSHAWRATMR